MNPLAILVSFLSMSPYLSQKFSDDLFWGLNLCSRKGSIRVSGWMDIFDKETKIIIHKCGSCLLIRLVIITKLEQLQWSHIYCVNWFRSTTEEFCILLWKVLFLKTGHALRISLVIERKVTFNFMESNLIFTSILIYKTASILNMFYRTYHCR